MYYLTKQSIPASTDLKFL